MAQLEADMCRRGDLPFRAPLNKARRLIPLRLDDTPHQRLPWRKELAFTHFSGIIRLMNWREHILSDPQILRGKPCLKGTRIPVALILGYLAAGRDTVALQQEFPDLKATDVAACLDYARELAEFEAAPA